MKTIRTIAAIAAIIAAAGCAKDPTGQTPEPERGKAPRVRITGDNETVIYPAEYDGTATILFEAAHADEVSVSAEEGFTVKTELTRLEGDSWRLELSGAEGMEKGRKYNVSIQAVNEHGWDYNTAYVEMAYMENPFGAMEAHYLSNKGKTFDIFVEGNVEWEATVSADGQSWSVMELMDVNHLVFRILPNQTKSQRELVLTLADKAGVYSYSCTYGQERCDETHEEIIAKEQAAIDAFARAFGLELTVEGPWNTEDPDVVSDPSNYVLVDYNYPGGGIGFNDKGYVTSIGFSGISGYLPEEIGDLKFCKELNLSACNLSGKLPESIGNMSSLKEICITNYIEKGYGLEGQLTDSSLSKIAKNLRYIHLGFNNFTGGFPEWIGDTPSSCMFSLTMNRLEGKVPEKVQVHPDWNKVIPDGSGKLSKEVSMKQQEGYILYE